MKAEFMKISEVADLLCVPISTLRYYDKIGLFIVRRDLENHYRVYTVSDIEHLKRIIILRDLGLSIEEIKNSYDNFNIEQWEAFLEKKYADYNESIKKQIILLEEVNDNLQLIYKIKHSDKSFVFQQAQRYKQIGTLVGHDTDFQNITKEYLDVLKNYDKLSGVVFKVSLNDAKDDTLILVPDPEHGDIFIPEEKCLKCFLTYEGELTSAISETLDSLASQGLKHKGYMLANSVLSHMIFYTNSTYLVECFIPLE